MRPDLGSIWTTDSQSAFYKVIKITDEYSTVKLLKLNRHTFHETQIKINLNYDERTGQIPYLVLFSGGNNNIREDWV